MIFKILQIQNFQSHKNSLIEFDPSVTALVGLGNHGKSAVLKALIKVVRNEPNGSSFIRNLPEKAKLTTLTLQTEDKKGITYNVERKVSRSSSNAADNMYKVKSSSGEEFEFTKFARTGIPEEISRGLGTSLPQLFGDVEFDLNFHIQKENDFLIRGKGLSSIRSKVLGKVTGVDIAQKAIQIGRLKEKNFNQEVDKLRKQRQDWNLELDKYKDLDNFIDLINKQFEKINELNTLQEDIEYYKISLDNLRKVINDAVLLKRKIESVSITFNIEKIKGDNNLLNQLQKLYILNVTLEKINKLVQILQKEINVENLKDLLQVQKLVQSLLNTNISIKRLNKTVNSKVIDLEDLKQCREKINMYKKYQSSFNNLVIYMYDKEQEINKIDAQHKIVQLELEDYKKEIGVCPICQKPF